MPPAVFAELEFSAALERAATERKLLLVDATAEWCGPCKMMDRTTWVDDGVMRWLSERALAIQIDVDAQKDVARELRIQAMPTIIAFIDGKEFDRVVGAKKPSELLAWLEGVLRGETSISVVERTARSEPENMRARCQLARELLQAGRYAEALPEYVWLWEHMLEYQPSLHGVRLSFFAGELEQLAKAYAAAREAIVQLRDRVAPSDTGPIDAAKFRDWTCLNKVLGEGERSLTWYDALPQDARPTGRIVEHHIIPLLIGAGRWADAGALYEEPLVTLNRTADVLLRTAELTPHLVELHAKFFRQDAAKLVRALTAAGRTSDVEQITKRAREVDPSDEMEQAMADAKR